MIDCLPREVVSSQPVLLPMDRLTMVHHAVNAYRFRREARHLVCDGVFDDVYNLPLDVYLGPELLLGKVDEGSVIVVVMRDPEALNRADLARRPLASQLLNRFAVSAVRDENRLVIRHDRPSR